MDTVRVFLQKRLLADIRRRKTVCYDQQQIVRGMIRLTLSDLYEI
jgi:hypothetical protein